MLKIYNTLTQQKEVFKSIHPNHINMYVCGPTVYGDIHLGNARPIIFFDVLKRYLTHIGYTVNYVSNITDVDDKIIDKAKELKMSELELTQIYTDHYFDMSKKVGSQLPNLMPKATEYVSDMIHYIDELIQNGDAYAKDSGVYFRVRNVSDYGILSKQNIDELNEGVRITLDQDKEDPRDFSVWKNTTDGLSFDSPWGKGRPGWHTECAVMNHIIFKEEIDIHGGGSDLKFPHHENEMAQTVAHSNHHLARYWMHVGRLDVNQEKMSKSLGNMTFVKDLVKSVDPLAFRLLMVSHHYRQPINYSDDLMQQFVKEYDKIERSLKKVFLTMKLNGVSRGKPLDDILIQFHKLMEDDFNTPNVMTIIQDLIKQLNKEKDELIKTNIYETLSVILHILGVMPEFHISDDALNTYRKWEQARLDKDYQKADELRKMLLDEGLI
ncbi:MAG: cysteine--tRNA ligase [Acholeplasmataceae bacterium]